MIVDHEISDGIGRIRLAAVVNQQDVEPLVVVVGDYVRDARCSSIEIDMDCGCGGRIDFDEATRRG